MLTTSPTGQQFIKEPLKKLGFNPNMQGVCRGYAIAFVESAVIGELDKFNERIKFIKSSSIVEKMKSFSVDYQKRLHSVNELKLEGKKRQEFLRLTLEEQAVVDVLAFFNKITLHQLYEINSAFLLNQPLKQHHIISLSDITKSLQLEKEGGLAMVYSESMIYRPSEWCSYFEDLRNLLQCGQIKKTSQLVVDFSIYSVQGSHNIALKYDNDVNEWKFCDANLSFLTKIPEVDDKDIDLVKLECKQFSNVSHEAIRKNANIIKLQQMMLSINEEFIAGTIYVLSTQNNSQLSKIKEQFNHFKNTSRSYCPSLQELLERSTLKEQTLLNLVATTDDADSLTKYLHFNLNLQQINEDGLTPFHIAAAYGSANVMRLLVKHQKETLNQVTQSEKSTAAFLAAKNNNPEILDILYQAKADINRLTRDDKCSPLYIAAQEGSAHALEFLTKLELKTDLNDTGVLGQTAAFAATKNNHATALKILAIAGADLQKQNQVGWSPLHVACQEHATDALKVLIEAKVNIDMTTTDGFTAAYISALEDQRVDSLSLLIKNGANLRKPSSQGWIPLHIASQNGCAKAVELLINSEAKCINQTLPNGETAVLIPAQNNHSDIIELLANAGADISKGREDGIGPMHMAANLGYINVIKMLQQYGANALKEDADGNSALHYALVNLHWNVVEEILKKINFENLNKEDQILIKENQGKLFNISTSVPSFKFFDKVVEQVDYRDQAISNQCIII